MHDDEFRVTAEHARQLLDAQFPGLRCGPLTPLAEFGTDHVLYRFTAQTGDALARFPRVAWAADQAARAPAVLQAVARALPVAAPRWIETGEPEGPGGLPWQWSVVSWLPGRRLPPARASTSEHDPALVSTLAATIRALTTLSTTDLAPASRDMRVAARRPNVEAALAAIRRRGADASADIERAEAVWLELSTDAALDAGETALIHGDLGPGNLLAHSADGALVGIIDWGGAGIGDPALDLGVAWNTLTSTERPAFHDSLDVDDIAWRRGGAWALAIALVALPYYETRLPNLATQSRATIGAVCSAFA